MLRTDSRLRWSFAITITITASVVFYYLSFSSLAEMQAPTKKTISELKYHPKHSIPPVKLQGLKISGRSVEFSSMFGEKNKLLENVVNPEAEFEAGDDFLEKTSFEIISQSNKVITFIRFMVHLYTKEGERKRSFDAAFPIDYGRPPGVANSWRLAPEAKAIFSVPPEKYADLRRVISQLTGEVKRVGIYASVIYFEDGSYWTADGKFFPTKVANKSNINQSKKRFGWYLLARAQAARGEVTNKLDWVGQRLSLSVTGVQDFVARIEVRSCGDDSVVSFSCDEKENRLPHSQLA